VACAHSTPEVSAHQIIMVFASLRQSWHVVSRREHPHQKHYSMCSRDRRIIEENCTQIVKRAVANTATQWGGSGALGGPPCAASNGSWHGSSGFSAAIVRKCKIALVLGPQELEIEWCT